MYFNFNPDFAFKSLEKQIIGNPKFREFYETNKTKSVEEICRDYGLDYNTVKKLIG